MPGRQHQVVIGVGLAMLLGVLVTAIWWRNRDIVRDLYDYSTLIGAAGKIEAGARPYADVRSPMQTSVYYLNWLTERIFGFSYLGLTWGGLIQAWGGGWLVGAILWRRTGPVAAVLVAGAIMLAGCIQHMGFFYNPVGIVCFSVIVLGLAQGGMLWPLRSPEGWLVCLALFVSGTNKLNFHGLALAIGGLLVLRSRLAGELSGRRFFGQIVILGLAGVLAPFAFELIWTGSSPGTWWQNVVQGPTARYEAARHFTDWRIFIQPAHDFHHHILFSPLGGLGLLLILITGAGLLKGRRRSGAGWSELGVCVVLIGAGIAGGALLMVTNYETVVLTSLAFPVSALALYLSAGPAGRSGASRWWRTLLLVGAAVWLVDGGYAAWHGSRLLYGKNPPPRSDYTRLVNASKPRAYFEGVRFLKADLVTIEALTTKLEAMEDANGHLKGVLFGPAVEWLERAYPEAIVRGMPIWYHYGTSLRQDDLAWFRDSLRRAGVDRILVNVSWECWPPAIAEWLRTDFQAENLGDRYRMYSPRRSPLATEAARSGLPPARAFRDSTGSNILLADTVLGLTPEIRHTLGGDGFLGASHDWQWDWPQGARVFSGLAIAMTPPSVTPVTVSFRILAGDGEDEELLWEMPLNLEPGQREVRRAFALQTDGRPLRLEVRTDGARDIQAGWRQIHITQSIATDSTRGLPVLTGLTPVRVSDQVGTQAGQLWFGSPSERMTAASLKVPFEHWRRCESVASSARVSVQFIANPADPADPVVVALVWYQAGRFEILTEQMIDLRKIHEVTLEGHLPESGGWVGVLARPAGGSGAGHLGAVQWLQ